MALIDVLGFRRAKSNIAPIARIGKPVKSKASRYASLMPENDTRLGYLKHGNLLSALTSGTKGYLGFKGASQDYAAERAYNEYLAQLAEQDRLDKLAQQAAEMDFKERELAQKKDLAQMNLEAEKARAELAREQALQDMATKRAQAIEDRNAQFAHEQSIYDRNRAAAIADRDAQLQAAIDAENRKRSYEEEQLSVKQLDPASQQQYYDMKNQGQKPVIVDNKVGFIGKLFGRPKYRLSVSDALKKGGSYSSAEADIMSKGLK